MLFRSYITPANQTTIKKYEDIQYKGDLYSQAILGIPSQMLGGIITTPVSDKTAKDLTGFGFFNPKNQFKAFEENFKQKNDIFKANKINTKLQNLNTKYDKGKIDYDTYNLKFNYLSNLPYYKSATAPQNKFNFYERVAKTNWSERKKAVVSDVLGITDIGTFILPPVRIIRGGNAITSGIYDFSKATTKREKILSGVNIGFGTAMVVSGAGGSLNPFKLPKTKSVALKVAGGIGGFGIRGGLGGLYGYSNYRKTGSIGVGIGSGLGAMTGLYLPELYSAGKWTGKKLWENQKLMLGEKKGSTASGRGKRGSKTKQVQKSKQIGRATSRERV